MEYKKYKQRGFDNIIFEAIKIDKTTKLEELDFINGYRAVMTNVDFEDLVRKDHFIVRGTLTSGKCYTIYDSESFYKLFMEVSEDV